MPRTKHDPTLDAIVKAALASGATLSYRDGELTVKGEQRFDAGGDTQRKKTTGTGRGNARHAVTAQVYGRNDVVKSSVAKIIYCAVKREKLTRSQPEGEVVDTFYMNHIHHDLLDQITTEYTTNRVTGVSSSAVVAALYTNAVGDDNNKITRLTPTTIRRVARQLDHKPRYPGSVFDLYIALVTELSKDG